MQWTVDYGDGPRPITIPHAWRQDVPVSWEGPAVYRTTVDPASGRFLVFDGVSYEAVVELDGREVLVHRGIWDAFAVDLGSGTAPIEVTVRVTKNGGPRFPVRDVASGFLPFVFHTFGGIYGEVGQSDRPLSDRPAGPPPARCDGHRIFVGDRPVYPRGLLHWGWYPEVGHPNPPDSVVRDEIARIASLGFDLVKFCLWIPRRRYFELLAEAGLWAWVELPLWDPTPDPERLAEMAAELERIVRQLAHHPNILLWTVGCELSQATPPAYRRDLVEMIHRLVPGSIVKDNSGGAEMYGGDLREYGDFDDFHPYCDTAFYPPVLDSLLPGPRPSRPLLLGEFDDLDAHRDLIRLSREDPYWASTDPNLNDKGVRWQHDLPGFLHENPVSGDTDLHARLTVSSRSQAAFVRKTVQEEVRAREAISGYVVTGLRDTPISTSGFFDDWGAARFSAEEVGEWNGEVCLFRIRTRRPPWVHGGNRPGWLDPGCFEAGPCYWRIGAHAVEAVEGSLRWTIESEGRPVFEGEAPHARVDCLSARQVAEISVDLEPGDYVFVVRFGESENRWPIWVIEPVCFDNLVRIHDPALHFEDIRPADRGPLLASGLPPNWHGEQGGVFLDREGTLPMPFWREAAYDPLGQEWRDWGYDQLWDRILSISGDRGLDPDWLDREIGEYETILRRIDTRTYRIHPVLVRTTTEAGRLYLSSLRPFGGLGCQPYGVTRNPSGKHLLRKILET
jgi:hypothetical protein